MEKLSPLRSRLASFSHAYAVATRLHRTTGRPQYVVRTMDPARPFRVTATPPADPTRLLATVLRCV